jgi:glycosyltransferase involved in cell wall biosynthesis
MQSKISVLQIIPQLDVSGASQGCIDIANYLSENNHNSYVITQSGPSIHKIKNYNENVFLLPVDSKNPITMIINIFRIRKLTRELKIDILHVRSRAPAWSCFFVSRLTGVKLISTFHGAYNFTNPLKKFYNSIMLRTDGTIAISNFIMNEVIKKYGNKKNVVRLISRGIDLDFFNPDNIDLNEDNEIYNKFKINNQAIKILLPGRLTGWKGHMLLLKALNIIFENTTLDIEVIFVGPDNNKVLRNSLINFAKQNNFYAKLHLVGSSNEINKFYFNSDIVVSPSTDPEAFGRISVESQAMGKFVIASNHGGSKETIIDGETGYLFDPLNEVDLSNKILKAIEEGKYKSNKVRERCIRNAKDNFSKKKMCIETYEFYKIVLK